MADFARVRVRRTGGFVGRAVEGSVELDGSDDREPEIRGLLARIDLAAAPEGQPWPDMYSFTFELGDRSATVPEHLLTPDLRRLAELVLG
jgi:emfourin